MALTAAYRNQLGRQFIESYLYFIYHKRRAAELLAKGSLTAEEANILQHCQQAVIHDRGVFQKWVQLVQAQDGYTLAQIKTFILSHRAAVLDILRSRYEAEMAEIDNLKDETEASDMLEPLDITFCAVRRFLIHPQPDILLAELDERKALRYMWRQLVVELRDMAEAAFAAEAEIN